ncbi:hypothetical protein [Halomonas lysinitropha]|uniref:Tetratricopeptide repeat protein n=1 Tax=Halomonas lysinitropha TaxID=2607506 RepID=A0A5K1IBG5_9GAMM|nr:hypothetical protein [Halomonas lysinitropha]VVZ95519.1 hypothetical protein HALO32_01590 [Halomonas lysinitropha]
MNAASEAPVSADTSSSATGSPGLARRAARAFQKGDYTHALGLYREAASQYGDALFRANIILCERRLEAPKAAASVPEPQALSRQLAETQRLLEHYFNRCETLEHRLLERG